VFFAKPIPPTVRNPFIRGIDVYSIVAAATIVVSVGVCVCVGWKGTAKLVVVGDIRSFGRSFEWGWSDGDGDYGEGRPCRVAVPRSEAASTHDAPLRRRRQCGRIYFKKSTSFPINGYFAGPLIVARARAYVCVSVCVCMRCVS